MIKKFNNFNDVNESVEYSKYEKKAMKLGYNVGDVVYNNKMKKYLTVVKNSRSVLDDNKDVYCTLGSIGEFPNTYNLIKSYNDNKKNNNIENTEPIENVDIRLSVIKNKIKRELNNLKNISTDSELIDDLEKLLNKL